MPRRPANAHEPTEQLRNTVRTLAGFGMKPKEIGAIVGLKGAEVEKHYGAEMERGVAQANSNIGRSLYDQAVGRDAAYDADGRLIRVALAPVPAAAIFLGKARLGLRESPQSVEVSGPGGGPIEIAGLDLSALTDDEIAVFRTLVAKARARPPAKAKA